MTISRWNRLLLLLAVALICVASAQELDQQGAILEAHNSYRQPLNLAPLTWSSEAASLAQSYANQCTYAHNANRGMFGENIAAGIAISLVDAIMLWGDEKADYICPTNECSLNAVCGHYTQIVWNGTREVGCAIARCDQNSPFGPRFPQWTMVVCDYSPPGNFIGQRPFASSQCPAIDNDDPNTNNTSQPTKRMGNDDAAAAADITTLVPDIVPRCSFFFNP